MDSNKNNFDKDIFFNYINNYKLKTEDVACLMRLYRVYILVNELKKENPDKSSDILNQYEDKIYTVDGKKIPEMKRIELEISKISKKLIEKNNTITGVNKIQEDINELKKLLKDLSSIDKSLLEYIKKKISVMQAMLGLNNTFLESAYEAFLEKYRTISTTINIVNENKKDDFDLEFIQKLKNFNSSLDNKIKGK